jgi:hypothetical protein
MHAHKKNPPGPKVRGFLCFRWNAFQNSLHLVQDGKYGVLQTNGVNTSLVRRCMEVIDHLATHQKHFFLTHITPTIFLNDFAR